MRPLWMGVLVTALAAAGCATTSSPSAQRPRAAELQAAAEARVKLAVLPVESDQFPRAASELTQVMRDVHVRGVDDYFWSKASLEVVQLSIECVEPTSACYAAVGKSLTAQKLLLAQISPTGTRKRDKGLRVTVTMFDVEAGAAVNVADRTFKTEGDALSELTELVAQAVNASSPARAAK